MLSFSLDFKGNRQTIESREPVFYTLADLQSDEEAESIIMPIQKKPSQFG